MPMAVGVGVTAVVPQPSRLAERMPPRTTRVAARRRAVNAELRIMRTFLGTEMHGGPGLEMTNVGLVYARGVRGKGCGIERGTGGGR